jgi:hypothetical protein
MQTVDSIKAILARITYKHWLFDVLNRSGVLLIRVYFDALDAGDGTPARQYGRKWHVSAYASNSELIQTAFLAVKTAEEHELRESFQYAGQSIFGPHFDVEQLHALAEAGAIDARPHHAT